MSIDASQIAEVFLAPPQPASQQLKQVILDRIGIGMYPAGTKLPSVRELAENLGINRNTVSKVYRELEREGVTHSAAGKGVFVRSLPDTNLYVNPREQLGRAVGDLVRRARVFGLSQEDLTVLFDQAIKRAYRNFRIAFIECSLPDTNSLAQDIASYVNEKVDPVILADFLQDPESCARQYDVVCTTYFHIAEINAALANHPQKIVAMQVTPRAESLLQLTQYTEHHVLGVLATNERTLKSVTRIIQTYCPAALEPLIVSDLQVEPFFSRPVDAIVDTLSTHAWTTRWSRVPLITITYRIDPQTLETLRRYLAEELGRDLLSASSRKEELPSPPIFNIR